MTTIEKQNELRDKIINSFPIIFERLIVYKKQKNSVLVIMQDDKIVKIKPEEFKETN